MADEMTQAVDRFLVVMDQLRKMGMGNPSLGTVSVSPAQMALLDWVQTSPGCGVQDIAEGLGVTPPTVSVGVQRMEDAGLLKRKPNPQDKRSVQFVLTAKGQSVQQQVLNLRRRKLERILAGLTPQEQDTLLQLFEKALQSVERNPNR